MRRSDRGCRAIELDLDRLEAVERDGWMGVKMRGRRMSGPRDDARKVHPSLVPCAELFEADRKKHRNAVRTYPDNVPLSGFKIVAEGRSGT